MAKDIPEQGRYRVWMKDGYCFNVIAGSDREASKQAIHLATESIKGLSMDPADKRKAASVDYVQLVARAGRF